jgi:hypothetical protein
MRVAAVTSKGYEGGNGNVWLSESYQFVNNNWVLGFFIDCAIMPRSVANISTSVVSKPIMHEQTERDMRSQLMELAQKVIGGRFAHWCRRLVR